MKVNELRIGNLIEYNTDEGWELNKVDAIDLMGDIGEYFRPIPLTKGWLLKFGAKGTIDLYWLSLTNLKAEIHFEIYPKEIISIIKSQFCELILDEVKYIHQLQNLYFALTGYELKLSSANQENK